MCARYMAYTTAMDVNHLMNTLHECTAIKEDATRWLELSNRNNTSRWLLLTVLTEFAILIKGSRARGGEREFVVGKTAKSI